MTQRFPQAERLHETFLQRLAANPPSSAWKLWPHAQARQIFRSIGRAEVEEVLLCGRPVELVAIGSRLRLLLLGETQQGRLLHLVCELPPPRGQAMWVWEVVTAYDPRTESFRWSADYTARRCRCHPHAIHTGGG